MPFPPTPRSLPAPRRRVSGGPAQVVDSTVLPYTVRGEIRGIPYRASARLAWQRDGDRYEATLEVRALLMGSRTQTSVGRITPQGLDQRFTEPAAHLLRACLAAALHRVASSTVAVPPLLARFSAVLILDSTTITLPDVLAAHWSGCGGRVVTGTQAALKCTAALDLCRVAEGSVDPHVYGRLGNILRTKQDFAGAERAYRRAVELEPSHSFESGLSRHAVSAGPSRRRHRNHGTPRRHHDRLEGVQGCRSPGRRRPLTHENARAAWALAG